uniref:NET domain-containing protein n=1 Tax=Fagus sylvatica TaxID=28930 RepID=A0A2N9FFK7_FAGSY
MPVDPKLKPPGYGQLGRTTILKKPKAKDPDKRDMTYEEKQRLSLNLQSLPSDKLDNIVQIIKKRNPTLFQHDDEIEVDIASVDPETLWELDRFVTNYKKSLSKNKRKTEIAIQSEAEAEVEAQVEAEVEVVEVEAEAEVEVVEAEVEAEAEAEAEVEVEVDSETDHAIPETNLAPAMGEATIETEAVENNVTEFNPVQEEKQGDNVSGSSSSSSSSSGSGSSSSDSDTDSSSASGSDADH